MATGVRRRAVSRYNGVTVVMQFCTQWWIGLNEQSFNVGDLWQKQ